MMAFLAGCDEIKFNGSLGVNEVISFSQVKSLPGSGQVVEWEFNKASGDVVLNPGQFPTKIIMGKSGSNKTLKLEVANANPATVINLKFDKNIDIPENFTLTAAQLGQNFDLTGTLVTTVERSPEQSGNEYCTYQYPQTVCRSSVKDAETALALKPVEADLAKFGQNGGFPGQIPNVPNPQFYQYPGQYPGQFNNPGYTPNCYTVWQDRPGNMYVRYYNETTFRDINAGFVQGEKSLANYKGRASSTERIYTYQGQCR
ncbi:MAG: hypothetical protein AUJ51_04630 [Elusimicrobia bacterium CG1_02_56_21]|nr:MAG: hypothetical protein AUJ51_04630 [Elusimicrobia bacterium CG1_02_56_21]